MQHSDKPFKELNLAADLLEEMSRAQNLDQMEALWKRFLHHLDRVWNKAEAHYSSSPKWDNWRGKYISQRRKDPLLSYLINARNVDEHSIAEIAQQLPGMFMINPPQFGGTLKIDRLTIENGIIEEFRSSTGAKIYFEPSQLRLLPVTNHGRTYNPPTMHQGRPINPNDVLGAAQLGISFYREFLSAAEVYFVSSP